ncbi:hypothetical protein KW803_00365 [Candidatus Saccharibacteria bacterium]|nr:hypothetical protein [Candidatus Saccharibacteria bacterium]
MEPLNPTNLNLHHMVPTVVADGQVVFISDNGNIPTLTFFQVRNNDGNQAHADVVASVRMNNLEDLKILQKAIADTIKQHASKEP